MSADLLRRAVAAHTDADALRTRIRRVIRSRDVGQLSAEEATEAILDHIAAYRLRQPNRGAYTHRVTVRADELEAPSTGPKWQVLDARDEVTWHDLEAVVDCKLGERCPDKVAGKECVVLIGKAWADGFAHAPEDTPVVVRIPAAVNL